MVSLQSCSEPHPTPDPPTLPTKVILITIDTLRADHLGFMGYGRAKTPNLDRLAKEGAFFSRFYATSSTTPMSMGTILSGLHPFSHGFTYGSLDSEGYELTQPILSDKLLLLPEFLQGEGHLGFGVATNPHLTKEHGFAQGLEDFVHVGAYRYGSEINRHAPIKQFKEALRAGEKAPFFWAHYIDPHDPWWDSPFCRNRFEALPPKETLAPYTAKPMAQLKVTFPTPTTKDGERIEWLYDCDVSKSDHYVGALLSKLGADENTLTVVTSDHGESFGAHGSLGHGFSLYEDLIHIPLIVHWPAGITGGQQIENLASLIDVYPTIVDLLGYTPPAPLPGQSLTPLLRGGVASHLENQSIFADLNQSNHALHSHKHRLKSIRSGDYKLILDHTNIEETLSLFQVVNDPGETKDISAKHPKIVQAMARKLTRHRESLPPPPNSSPIISKDGEEIEALKAMGYIE